MDSKVKEYFTSIGLEDITVLSGGVFLAQLIGIVAQPIATRIYTPEDFGVLNLILSLTGIFSPIMCLQYEYCIIVAKDHREANQVTALCLSLCTGFTVLFGIGLVIYNLISPKSFELAGGWLYTAIPILFITGISSVVTSYNSRYGEFPLIAKMSVYRAAISNGVKLLLGALHVGFPGLLLSNLLSNALGLRKQATVMLVNRKEILQSKLHDIVGVMKKYRSQALFSTPGVFIVGYSFAVIPMYINALFGTAQVGFYSLATSSLSIPLSVVSTNVGKVFFRNASKEKNETGMFINTLRKTVLFLTAISVAGFTVLYFISEPLFGLVFGEEWRISGLFAKYLIPMYAINFVANATINGLIICEEQKKKMMVQSLFLVFSLATYLVAKIYALSIGQFLGLVNWTYVINYLLLMILLFRKALQIKK
jgi:O-antigen/teichoic acid export membrane protein